MAPRSCLRTPRGRRFRAQGGEHALDEREAGGAPRSHIEPILYRSVSGLQAEGLPEHPADRPRDCHGVLGLIHGSAHAWIPRLNGVGRQMLDLGGKRPQERIVPFAQGQEL